MQINLLPYSRRRVIKVKPLTGRGSEAAHLVIVQCSDIHLALKNVLADH